MGGSSVSKGETPISRYSIWELMGRRKPRLTSRDLGWMRV